MIIPSPLRNLPDLSSCPEPTRQGIILFVNGILAYLDFLKTQLKDTRKLLAVSANSFQHDRSSLFALGRAVTKAENDIAETYLDTVRLSDFLRSGNY